MTQGVTVDFNANIARFTSALDKASNDLSKFQKNAERTSGAIEKAFKVLGAGLVIHQLFEASKAVVNLADHMNDLATTTGLTVEQIAGLNLAAKQSGTDLDSVAAAVAKLTENMGKEGAKFAEIGISAKDPVEALKQLADVMAGIEDPQQRAAVASVALGKSWKTVAPLLAEGSKSIGEMVDKGAKLSGNIGEMARKSDELNDKVDEMQTAMQGLIVDALLPLIPVLKTVAEYISDTSGEAESGGKHFEGITTAFKYMAIAAANAAFVTESLGMILVGIYDTVNTFEWHGMDAIIKGIDEAEAKLSEFEKKLLNPPEPEAKKAKPVGTSVDPESLKKFIGGSGIGEAEALAKKILEQHLKRLEGSVKEEAALLSFRNKLIDFYYAEDKLSIKSYYEAKNAAQDENLTKTIAAYDKEIALLERHKNAKSTKDVDKVDDSIKINALYEKRTALISENSEASLISSLQEGKAVKDLEKSLASLNVRYLEMNANTGKAAGLSFDLANAQLQERVNTEGNIEAQKQLNELRARAVENASTKGEDGFRRSMRNYVEMANDSATQIERLMTGAFKGMEDSLVAFVRTGKLDFSSLADSIISDLLRISIRQQILGPLAMFLGAGRVPVGGAPAAPVPAAANGAYFDGGASYFASGGIFDSPTSFKFASGGSFKNGILGEAGPEAIMPLKRDSSGRLGVQSSGGGSIVYSPVINIDSRTDQSEVARLVDRAVKNGNEQLMDKLRRQGQLS